MFNDALAFTLRAEGGFVNNPADPGGATNMGITLAVFREYFPDATVDQIKSLTAQTAAHIYQEKYWNALSCDQLPSGCDLMVFDFGVNAGIHASAKILQTCIGADADGVIGAQTLQAVKNFNLQQLVLMLTHAQAEYYRQLPGFQKFGNGWINRTTARKNAALKMIPI